MLNLNVVQVFDSDLKDGGTWTICINLHMYGSTPEPHKHSEFTSGEYANLNILINLFSEIQ